MIKVLYKGRLGNQLFQYSFGRILAEKLGYRLEAEPIPGFPETSKQIEGKDLSDREPLIVNEVNEPLESFIAKAQGKYLVLDGFFQESQFYEPLRDEIRSQWFPNPNKHPRDSGEVVAHIRRGDYVDLQLGLQVSYYLQAFDKLQSDRLYIVTDSPADPFLKKFRSFKPTIISKSPIEDLRFISDFKKIVGSNSSFSWWAVFLSNAESVVFPDDRAGVWAGRSKLFQIHSVPRWEFIACQETYQHNFRERVFFKCRDIKNALLVWLYRSRLMKATRAFREKVGLTASRFRK